jgi:hypothetical protein
MFGLLLHVGDDVHPSLINWANHSDYELHLLPGHADPDLDNLTYGDWAHRSKKFKELSAGDSAFFSFKFTEEKETAWYITSYFYLERVLTGREVLKARHELRFRSNAHLIRGDLNNPEALDDFRLLVGNPSQSRGRLRTPIRVDEKLWEAIDLRDRHGMPLVEVKRNRKHPDRTSFTVQQINGSYLRAPKPLKENQTHALTKIVERNSTEAA